MKTTILILTLLFLQQANAASIKLNGDFSLFTTYNDSNMLVEPISSQVSVSATIDTESVYQIAETSEINRYFFSGMDISFMIDDEIKVVSSGGYAYAGNDEDSSFVNFRWTNVDLSVYVPEFAGSDIQISQLNTQQNRIWTNHSIQTW